ncbi:MAG: glycosyltransferase family 9 protein [Elusimicrobia bacterium]|nr:glycosyltransferase family 9 protein [Elusimicrobiota bacterium]
MKTVLRILRVGQAAVEMLSHLPRRCRYRASQQSVKKILVLGYMGLGDMALFLPTLELLRRHYGAAQWVMACGPYSNAKELVERAGLMDKIIIVAWQHSTESSRRGVLRELRAMSFDMVIVPFVAPVRFFLPALMTIPCRAGYYRKISFPIPSPLRLLERLAWWFKFYVLEEELFRRYALNISVPLESGVREHERSRYLRLLEALDISLPQGQEESRLQIFPQDHQWADDFLVRHRIARTDRLVVLHAGASATQKWKSWPPEYFGAVVRWLVESKGAKVILLGLKEEQGELGPLLAWRHNCFLPLLGQTDVGQIMALMKRSSLFLGIDSGLGHLAATVGLPSLRLFGPTDEVSYGAWKETQKHRVLHAGISCRPCLVMGVLRPGVPNASNCGHFNCLRRQTPESLCHAIEEMTRW